MRSRSPAFSFYPKDWLSDANVKAMTLEAKGAYIELLGVYWLEDGLPAEPERLARLIGVPLARFRRLWPLLEPCFQVVENRLFQKRLEREREKQHAFTTSQREKGLKGGRPPAVGPKSSHINEDGSPWVSRTKAAPGLAQESLPSPSPSPRSTDTPPLPPPPDGGGEQDPFALPPDLEGRPGNGKAPQGSKARAERLEDARRYAIHVGYHPDRQDLRTMREWVNAGRTVAEIHQELDRSKAEGDPITPRKARL